MGFFDSIAKAASAVRRTFSRRQPDRIIELMPGWQGRDDSLQAWTTADRSFLAKHFRGWNYIAIAKIAEAIGCMPPQVGRRVSDPQEAAEKRKRKSLLASGLRRKALTHIQDTDEIEPVPFGHPLCKLLRNPNPPDVAYSFLYKLAVNLEIFGAAYIYCPRDTQGVPTQFWSLPSNWVRPIPGEDSLVGRYEIRAQMPPSPEATALFGAGWFPGVTMPEYVDADLIVPIAYPSPFSLVDGFSPTQAIGPWIDGSEAIDASRIQTFRNGMFPGVVIECDKDVAFPEDQTEKDRLLASIKAKYATVRNTGEPVVLAPGMRMTKFSSAPYEMDYQGSAEQVKSWILAARGVGQSIVGMAENTTFASMTAARAQFYHGTVRPKLMFLAQVLSERLATLFDEDLVVYWPDPTPDDPDFKLRVNQALVGMSAKAPNEVRADYNLEPFEHGGDDPVGPGGQPLPWATGEDPMAGLAAMLGQGGMPGQGPPQMPGKPPGGPQGEPDAAEAASAGRAQPKPPATSKARGRAPIPTPLRNRINGHATKSLSKES